MSAVEKVDGRIERGRRTRDAVLNAAVSMASIRGLEGLSLADLAAELGVGKSTLFAHWAAKEEMQLAVVERALEQWRHEVIEPALNAPAGVRRLVALHEARLDFYYKPVLPGRCFFAIAEAEFDDRPGRIHDRVSEIKKLWLDLITSLAKEAISLGELSRATDPAQVAFVVEAIGSSVVTAARMLDNETAFQHARGALRDYLRGIGASEGSPVSITFSDR